MANNVNVEISSVQAGKRVCEELQQQLSNNASQLTGLYQEMGNGWRDEKYAQLGVIIEDCTSILSKVSSDIDPLKEQLDQLLQALNEYEQMRI